MAKQFIFNRMIFALTLVGLLISGYLLYTYVADAPIVCVNSGCEIVRESQYAYFLGIPLPVYGLLMYIFVFIISFLRTTLDKIDHHHLANKLIFLSALLGVVISAYLTYLEAFVIKAYCMWCVASAVIVTLILILSAIEIRRLK